MAALPGSQTEKNLLQIVPDMRTAFPIAKHEAFLENDGTYKASWLHKRRDLADKSLSGYDMSLASLAGQAGWSPGEIAALIRAHRGQSTTSSRRAVAPTMFREL